MQFNQFYVIAPDDKPNQHHIIYTDDIQETLASDYEDETVHILDEKDYTTEDYCNIVESLLEDVNAHKYCHKIHDIINTMKSVHIDETGIHDFARLYTHDMFETYGY